MNGSRRPCGEYSKFGGGTGRSTFLAVGCGGAGAAAFSSAFLSAFLACAYAGGQRREADEEMNRS
jgi:hypothetical protein